MKIGAISQLSGVSVRSIRHYHRLGLLTEPPRTSGGQRTYGIADLVRVLQIRHLAEAGVPLASVPGVLDSTTDDPVEQLANLRRTLDTQIESLLRRARLDSIAERIAEGLPLGLLPASVVNAIEACRAETGDDPGLRRLLDHEREMLDLLALSAPFPVRLADAYAAIGAEPERRRRYLDILDDFRAVEGRPPEEVKIEMDRVVIALTNDARWAKPSDHEPATTHGHNRGRRRRATAPSVRGPVGVAAGSAPVRHRTAHRDLRCTSRPPRLSHRNGDSRGR